MSRSGYIYRYYNKRIDNVVFYRNKLVMEGIAIGDIISVLMVGGIIIDTVKDLVGMAELQYPDATN